MLHKEALQINLRFPIPQVVAHFLYTYDLSLAQINPNGRRTLLSLVIVNEELGYKLEEGELRAIYCIKKSEVNEVKVYISAITLRGLILNFSNKQSK